MSSPEKLAHVVLYTGQIPKMRDWYLKVLDARVVLENPAAVFMTYDYGHHRIALADRRIASKMIEGLDALTSTSTEAAPHGSSEIPNRGLSHIAFTYSSLDKLTDNYERLKRDGIPPVFTINHGVTTSFYYADPDGNNIELQIDNFETIQEGTNFM